MVHDFAVIGAGMAGASLAAELAPHGSVVLVEGEQFPGYHTTGRSAAFWEACYGGPQVVPLTLASGAWLRDGGFMRQRGALYIAEAGDEAKVAAFEDSFAGTGVSIARVSRARMDQLVPGLRSGWNLAISEPDCADIDVGALHQHYLAAARRGGAQLLTGHRLHHVEREGGTWRLACNNGAELRASVLVNAAGAWADDVAAMAGARPLGITPYRLAQDIHVQQTRVGEILAGRRAITADTALRLARYFGTTPQLWMNLQAHYDLQRAGAECAVDLERIRPRAAG